MGKDRDHTFDYEYRHNHHRETSSVLLSDVQTFGADLTERVKQLYTEAWLNLLSSSSPQADSSLSFQ